MRTLFLFGLLTGCGSSWVPTGYDYISTDPELPYNLCEDFLDDLGYPVVIQADLTDPKPLTILYQEEPEERLCGGMVVETVNGEAWVLGMIEGGEWLHLLIPSKPPDQFGVVSWAMEDVSSDPDDFPDEDGIYWAGTNTKAQAAKFVQDSESTFWERQDLPNSEGVTTAYLVIP